MPPISNHASETELEWAELRCHDALLLRSHRLVVKNQDTVLIHASVDRRDGLGRKRLAQIDAVDLPYKPWMQWPDNH
jgi:hypothetical protein